ncbi:MAG: PhnD/SsuA/transferrin family substrate-binding protein [Gammaproteobacteria bacterium]|nr:PhnD/SsuA/transferrin family substrate-binding protein [Gammaproteobacteria bacterium]
MHAGGTILVSNLLKVLLTLPLALSSTLHADVNLNFGVYTSDKPVTMVKKFRPVLNAIETDLAKKMGEPVHIHLQVASSYKKGIDDLATGRVDFARMGPASYVISKKLNPSIELLAKESKKDKKRIYGVICVATNSPIQHLGELKGKSFAFGNERSTTGRYMSQLMLLEAGVLADDLGSYEYLGRHDRVGTAVGAGQFDAGALKGSTFKKLIKKGLEIREIVRFSIVTKPWIASAMIEQKMFTLLQETLLELKDEAALKTIKNDGFLPVMDAEYQRTREAIDQNGEFFHR